ncbi:MAG TPA: hypothetical protein VF077_12900 [Nitrospiraceae bacterium]
MANEAPITTPVPPPSTTPIGTVPPPPAPTAAPMIKVKPALERASAGLERLGIKSDPDVPAGGPDGTPAKPPVEKPATPPPAPDDDAPPTDVAAEKKAKPWKMYREMKDRASKLEAENLQLRSSITPEKLAEFQQKDQKLVEYQKKLDQHEEYIRLTNYKQSEEFKTKYEAPLQDAWKRALSDVSQLQVDDGAGGVRQATADDLMTLTSLPLNQAHAAAKQMFGEDFVHEVMGYRKELVKLWQDQDKALKDASTNGAAKIKAVQEQIKAYQGQIQKQVEDTWKEVNERVVKDQQFGKYFTPREGDTVWNEALEKGYKLADQAFSENAHDPRLKPEDRAAIIKRHAAVRNRAAAWGPLRHENEQLTAKLAKLESELASYKRSEPGAGSPKPDATAGRPPGKAIDRIMSGLEKFAH